MVRVSDGAIISAGTEAGVRRMKDRNGDQKDTAKGTIGPGRNTSGGIRPDKPVWISFSLRPDL